MARYGVVWCGWLCWWRPSPHPLPLVPLWGPSWEGSLFRTGRRTSEWMRKSSGGPLQWLLFVYTSQSRHSSLAAQPTDNFWCPNRDECVAAHQPWASAAQDKRLSRIPDTHIPTKSLYLPAFSATHGACAHTHAHTHSVWWGCMGELVLSSWAKRHWEVSPRQWSSNSPTELALHHRDVTNLPNRDTDSKREGLFSAAIFWRQPLTLNMNTGTYTFYCTYLPLVQDLNLLTFNWLSIILHTECVVSQNQRFIVIKTSRRC